MVKPERVTVAPGEIEKTRLLAFPLIAKVGALGPVMVRFLAMTNSVPAR
jgi:hypothetical protein